jgi:GDP-4-dehydro-6-deoxy-D-mannose reductase
MATNTILITGACGMVGSHLGEYYFQTLNSQCIGTRFNPTIDTSEVKEAIEYIDCDIRDFDKIFSIIEKYQPTKIFHLAAQSYPTVSCEKPNETIDINVNGTINVFESILKIRKTKPDYNPVVVVACSSAEYGSSLMAQTEPVDENVPLLPLHPYGVSKVGQDLITYQYYMNYGLKGIRARIFNTTGTRKVNDVVSDFTKRAILMERGVLKDFNVGNLSSKRAIADVKDLVSALVLLSDKGAHGDVYNVSGQAIYSMQELIDCIEKVTNQQLNPILDKNLLRPTDEPVIVGNSSKLIAQTGWRQTVSLEKTIEDMVQYWRNKL